MEFSEDGPLWRRVRDAVADGHVFYLNLPSLDDGQELEEYLLEKGVVTMSDWGLHKEDGLRFAPDSKVVSPDTVQGDFADPMAGRIDWDAIRDLLHETRFSDRDTKVRAGQVTSNIRLFVDEMAEGDIVLARLSSGVVPAVVRGPPRYSLSSEVYEMSESQVFAREVTWGRVGGSPIEIPTESLPPGFGPGRRTVGKVNDPSPVVGLLQGLEWIGEQL